MKMDMVKEFENIVEFLNTKYVDYFCKDPENREAWIEVKAMHLRSAKTVLALAGIYAKGEFKSHADKVQSKDTIDSVYSGFLELLPDEAFINS